MPAAVSLGFNCQRILQLSSCIMHGSSWTMVGYLSPKLHMSWWWATMMWSSNAHMIWKNKYKTTCRSNYYLIPPLPSWWSEPEFNMGPRRLNTEVILNGAQAKLIHSSRSIGRTTTTTTTTRLQNSFDRLKKYIFPDVRPPWRQISISRLKGTTTIPDSQKYHRLLQSENCSVVGECR